MMGSMDPNGIGMTSARTRDRLVQRLREQGIADQRVLEQIRNVPRHLFVDEALASRAYEDTALPIGLGQTISQPYMVAVMTELLGLTRESRVLEIGTGSGYQAAVLAELGYDGISVGLDRCPSIPNLLKELDGGHQRVAYLRTRIESPEARNVTLEIFSDDGVKAWLNGKLVHSRNTERGINCSEDVVKITLLIKKRPVV